MGLDVRVPIGMLFTLLGLLITGYGVVTWGQSGMTPEGVPIDVVWGVVLLVFGLLMFGLAERSRRKNGAAHNHE